jgi:hypothetical protein
MAERVVAALLLLTAEMAERYLGHLLVDATALYLAQRECSEIESWLQRQGFDEWSAKS